MKRVSVELVKYITSQIASVWLFAGGSHLWPTGDLATGSLSDLRWQPPEDFFKIHEITDINKQTIKIILYYNLQ